MKFSLLAVLAFAAVVSGAILPVNNVAENNMILVKNVIDQLIRQGLEVVRKMLKEHEPFEIPDLPPQTFVDEDKNINVHIDLKQVKLSKASDFTVDHIENNLPELWAKFSVSIPAIHLEGQYEVNGVVAGKQVSGSGTFDVDIQKFVQDGTIYMAMIDHALQMKSLELNYALEGLKFNLNGLSIEGMTAPEVEDLLNKKFFEYLQTSKKEVCGIVSKQVVIAANQIMAGKTLKELLDWLKDFIKHH